MRLLGGWRVVDSRGRAAGRSPCFSEALPGAKGCFSSCSHAPRSPTAGSPHLAPRDPVLPLQKDPLPEAGPSLRRGRGLPGARGGGTSQPVAVWGVGGVVSSDKAALKTLFRVRSIWGRWRVSRGSLGYTCSSHGGETPVILRAHPGSRGLREELQALDVETGGRRGRSPEGLWSWAPEGQAWRSSRPAPRPQRPRLQPAPPCFCASGCTRLCSGGARPPRSTWSA